MGQPVIQTSFNSGEWAPALNARVDLSKYHSGAALLRNFFVDYRGGATTRPGTKYISQTRSGGTVRLIPFQASLGVSYILEFGLNYIRFYNNGAPVLEAGQAPTNITNSNPGIVTLASHGYSNGDWIFTNGFAGMTQLNGNTYIVANVTTNTFTLTDLVGNPINTTSFGAFGAPGGTTQRVYTITTTYLDTEVFGIKYAQNVNILVLCHPNHPPAKLVLNTAASWTLSPITFGSTINPPTSVSLSSTLTTGTVFYGYLVTAVDINGQESVPAAGSGGPVADIRSTAGTNTLTWVAATGSNVVSYNVYRALPSYSAAVATGVPYGFCGNVTSTTFQDSNVVPDFGQPPPITQNPFAGSGVQTVGVNTNGSYTSVPSVSFTAAPAGGVTASGNAQLGATSVTIANGGNFYSGGDILSASNGIKVTVGTVGAGGQVTSIGVTNIGLVLGGSVPANPMATTGGAGSGCTLNATWGVTGINLVNPGSGYLVTPTISFIGGGSGATATAILGAASSGNPTVPSFVDQRMFLGGPVLSPAQFNMSQPGSIFNFNITFPAEADNAIQGTLADTVLNSIKSAIPISAGLLIFTDKIAWLVNGGQNGAPFSAVQLAANPQVHSGAADLPPVVAANDVLYVQSKGSIIRDLAYNFYLANYAGTDISILSSHLFYGFSITQWAWAEEPFKIVWAVRNDGVMLTLTFLKEQELIAWAHSDTQGVFLSVATVTEPVAVGNVDAVYVIVRRNINGQFINYIERVTDISYPFDYKSSWQVDAGIGYNSTPATTFSGAQHLRGQVVTGLADGVVINFTMPLSGTFVFGLGGTPGLTAIPNASIVTVGLSFLPQLQTLRLDLGEPTVQGKRKKISALTARVRQALGLSCGNTFATAVPMKDLVLGNVGTMSNQLVTGLVTDDARTIMDPNWTVQGQMCIQQLNPYPASILGIIPEIEVGDTAK